jgi:hypothetical protein
MIAAVSIPKLDKALRLLVALDRTPQSSVQLADTTGISRPHVVRLVASLRDMGCKIEAVRAPTGKGDFSYYLTDWGLFDPGKVRRYVKGLT